MALAQSALRKNLIERFSRERSNLLPALHYIHSEFGYLPDWAMEVTGWHLGIPVSEVFGAATSYSELRIDPLPKSLVRICDGLGCNTTEREKLKEVLQTRFAANADVEIEMIQLFNDQGVLQFSGLNVDDVAANLPCGVYTIKIITNKGAQTDKLVKLH